MTVISQTPEDLYVGTGAQVLFDFNFQLTAASQLFVDVNGLTQTVGVDYTVSVAPWEFGGTVDFTVGGAPASGASIKLYRSTPITQDVNLVTGQRFPADTLEGMDDKTTRILQEMDARFDDASQVDIVQAYARLIDQSGIGPLALTATPTVITGYTIGDAANMTADETTGEITVEQDGIYYVSIAANATIDGNIDTDFIVQRNGVTPVDAVIASLESTDERNVNGSVIHIDLVEGDVLRLVAVCATNVNVTIDSVNVSVYRIDTVYSANVTVVTSTAPVITPFEFGIKFEDGGVHSIGDTTSVQNDGQEVQGLVAHTWLAGGNDTITTVSIHASSAQVPSDAQFALYEHNGVNPTALVCLSNLFTINTLANRTTIPVTVNWPLEAGKRYTLGFMHNAPGAIQVGDDPAFPGNVYDENAAVGAFNWTNPAGGIPRGGAMAIWADGETET